MLDLIVYKNMTYGSPLNAEDWNKLIGLLESGVNANPACGLTVNGEAVSAEGGVLHLDAATGEDTHKRYVLSGSLVGRIEIGHADDVTTGDTLIVLDGLTVINPTTDCAIAYLPQSDSLLVTLANSKANHLVCNHVAEMAPQQGAALYSENNMSVQGCGYLSVINKGGHGIKASELRLNGRPHIYASAVHDAIHGNSMLTVCGGTYYINGANDAFGTGTTGKIHVFGGEFWCYNVKQSCFDSKVAGLWHDENAELNNMSDADKRTNMIWIDFSGDTLSKEYYDTEATVLDNGVPVTPVDNVYHCTSTSVELKGIIYDTVECSTPKVEVTLNNACIINALKYTGEGSNMQVNAAKDTVNYVMGMSSTNNLKIEVKSGAYLYVEGSITASETTIHDTAGTLVVYNPSHDAIVGTDIYFADSADHKAFADESVTGAIDIRGKVHARLSGKGKKANVTIKDENLLGVVIADEFVQDWNSTETTGINLDNSQGVFYKVVSQYDNVKNIPLPVNEPYKVMPFGELPIV